MVGKDTWNTPWRVGRTLGRTVYVQRGAEASKQDELLGLMETSALAAYVVQLHNKWAPAANSDRMARVLFDACDGPHAYVPHDDEQPPWCDSCRHTASGMMIIPKQASTGP